MIKLTACPTCPLCHQGWSPLCLDGSEVHQAKCSLCMPTQNVNMMLDWECSEGQNPHLSMIPSRVEPCCALAAACSCIILTRPARILATSCASFFRCKQRWSVPDCLLSCLA